MDHCVGNMMVTTGTLKHCFLTLSLSIILSLSLSLYLSDSLCHFTYLSLCVTLHFFFLSSPSSFLIYLSINQFIFLFSPYFSVLNSQYISDNLPSCWQAEFGSGVLSNLPRQIDECQWIHPVEWDTSLNSRFLNYILLFDNSLLFTNYYKLLSLITIQIILCSLFLIPEN